MHTTAKAMPRMIKGAWPLLTKTNIGYGEAIASTHMAHRNRVSPTFSATQAASA